MARACNSTIWEAEAGGFQVRRLPGLHSENFPQQNLTNKQTFALVLEPSESHSIPKVFWTSSGGKLSCVEELKTQAFPLTVTLSYLFPTKQDPS